MLTKLVLLYTPNILLDEVMGIEPTSSVWQTEVLTIELHLDGADSPIRTDVDFRLVVTNHVQSATMRYRHIRERKRVR